MQIISYMCYYFKSTNPNISLSLSISRPISNNSARKLHTPRNHCLQPFDVFSKSNGFFREIQAFLSVMLEFKSTSFKNARFCSTFELIIIFPAFPAIFFLHVCLWLIQLRVNIDIFSRQKRS